MAGKSDDLKVAIELAKDALALIEENGDRLADRLRAGTRDGLTTDVGFLAGVQSGSVGAARRDAKSATRDERSAAERAARAISRIRNAVHDAKLGKDVEKKWGVGIVVKPNINRTVIEAGSAIVSRARAAPEEARSIGLTAADVDGLEATLAAIDPADTAQRAKKTSAKAATKAQDDAIVRIFATVRHVGSAGELEFGHELATAPAGRAPDPARAKRFVALRDRATPPSAKRTRKKNGEGPASS